MIEFLNKLLKLLLLNLIILTSIYFLSKKTIDNPNSYYASIIDKHQHLDNLVAPRIIITGGSNVAFGINSNLIEKSLSKPIVNLSISGSMGYTFMLGELKNSIKEKDIVIICFEYFASKGVKENIFPVCEIFPQAKKYFEYSNIDLLISNLKQFRINSRNRIRRILNSSSNKKSVYLRSSFNDKGDMIAHLNKPNARQLAGRRKIKYKYWNAISELNQFYQYALEKNVKVFYLFPPYPKLEFEKNKDVIKLLRKDLEKKLRMPILGQPKDFVFNDSLFFDTVYHLNKDGRDIRTKKLIKLLNDYL